MAENPMVARSFKLPPHVDQMLDDVAEHMGLNKTAALIVAINELATKHGVSRRPDSRQKRKEDGE